jgi:hypothetical protein
MAIIVPILSTFDPAGINKAQRAFKGLSGTAKTATIAFAGLGVAVGKFGYDAVKAAAEDQRAQLKLAKTLQNVTGATQAQTAAVEQFITAQQFATGVADTKLRPALETLVRATGDVSKAQGLLKLGLDVSAGSGRDLESISIALAKAQGGQFTSLQRLGIVIPQNIKKSKDFAKVQEYLTTLFGGQAQVAAGTFEGKMAILGQRLSEAKETIGGKLIPVLTNLVDYFLQNVMPAIERVANGGFKQLGIEIANAINGLSGMAKVVKEVIFALIGIKIAFVAFAVAPPIIAAITAGLTTLRIAALYGAGAFKVLGASIKGALASSGIGLLVIGVGLVIGKLIEMGIQSNNTTDDVVVLGKTGTSRFQTMEAAANRVVIKMDEISTAARHASDVLENNRLIPRSKINYDLKAQKDAENAAKASANSITASQKKVAAAAKAAADTAAAAAKEMAKVVSTASKLATAALTKMNDKLTAARDKLKDAKQAFKDYYDGIVSAITGQFSFTNALTGFIDSQKNAKDAANNLTDAQNNYVDALRSGDIDKTRKALDDLTTAQKQNADATANKKTFLQSLKEQADAATNFASKVKTLIAMGLSQSGIDQVIAAGSDAGTAIANELIAGGAGAIKTTNDLTKSVEDAAKSLAKSGADKFYSAGVTQGQAMVDGIIASIKKAGFIISGGMAALPKPLQSAINKGSLTSGQVTELNKIIGNSQTVVAPNKSTSAATINLTVNAGMGANGATIGKDIVDAIKKYERTSGPVFKSA